MCWKELHPSQRSRGESELQCKKKSGEKERMGNKISKRQQIVKNTAIVFLVILLILTFFSNTIMNITLPEAVVAEINRDVITAQITGEGIAEAENLYSIVMSESRVIDSIPVTVGQEIKQGDVICYLQGEESDALADAVSRKEAMELEYNKLVLNNHVTETELQTLLTNGITLQECQTKLASVQDEQKYDQMLTHLLALMDIYSQYQEIQKQNELIGKYTAASMGTSLVSPLDGTIVEIQAVPGKRAEQNTIVAAVLPAGQKLYLEVPLEASDAEAITETADVQILSPSYLTQTSLILRDIQNDISSSENRKLVTFCIEGDEVSIGQPLTVEMNKRSEEYELVVPNAAIRKDKNGTYVLKVIQESSSLGNRYYAEQVYVEVLNQDEKQTAVSGALYGDEYLITESNRPIEDGQQVRLIDQ